ncbi:MAG: phage tail protein [Myxococcota bacterium]|nr:phage tail protein [Myxococcota bacterium]
MSNPTNNYIGSFHFRVTIEGINDPLDGFLKVSKITSTTENMDFKHGLDSAVRKAPGRTTYDDITLERVYSGLDEFYAWRQAIEAGNIDRRTVSIEFLRSDHTTMRRYVLLNAYPSKWELPAMDASGSQAATEVITLSLENVLQLE